MHGKFLKNLALLLFLNLLVKPFWILGIDRQVQNVVGTDEYGFYFSIFNFSFLFFIFLDLGITNFNNRNIAQNNQLLNKHLAGIASLKFLLGILYGIIIFAVGILIGYRGRQLYLLAWVGFNQFLLSFILYLRSNISGLLLFKTDSFLSILDRILMIFFVGAILWSGWFPSSFKIEWYVYSQTLAYGITVLVALVAVLNKSGRLKLNWNTAFFLMIIKKSLPFALLVLIMSFYNRIDTVLLERLLPSPLGAEQSGVYALAYRLLDAGQNFAYLFAVLLLPLFSKMIKEHLPVGKLVRISFSIIITGAVLIAVTATFFGKNIMELMYTQHSGETLAHFGTRILQSEHIFKILMFSFVAVSSNYIFGTLLTANNNLKALNYIALSGLVTNLLLNFILIPEYHAIGSAYASLGAQTTTALLQMGLAFKYFKLDFSKIWILKFFAAVFLMFFSGYLISTFSEMSWGKNIVVFLIFGILTAFALKLLNIKEFISIIKNDKETTI
jgi:O-antigen/teichoic acid export membrane protein